MARRAVRPADGEVKFFATSAHLRRWFEQNHETVQELWVGFHRKDSGRPSVTWPESVDEALCVGWIDGIRKRIDEESYKIRFTPRRAGSIWSAINVRRVAVLEKEGRMRPAGRGAFSKKRENKSGIYSYEQRPAELPEPYRSTLAADRRAAEFLAAQSPSYRKLMTWFILSAKREDTRLARLEKLVAACHAGRRL
jgi:uncharacterized protein YdeI (YjbR/CyaY-like superfamily)